MYSKTHFCQLICQFQAPIFSNSFHVLLSCKLLLKDILITKYQSHIQGAWSTHPPQKTYPWPKIPKTNTPKGCYYHSFSHKSVHFSMKSCNLHAFDTFLIFVQYLSLLTSNFSACFMHKTFECLQFQKSSPPQKKLKKNKKINK